MVEIATFVQHHSFHIFNVGIGGETATVDSRGHGRYCFYQSRVKFTVNFVRAESDIFSYQLFNYGLINFLFGKG